jgi:hypothetical protein
MLNLLLEFGNKKHSGVAELREALDHHHLNAYHGDDGPQGRRRRKLAAAP